MQGYFIEWNGEAWQSVFPMPQVSEMYIAGIKEGRQLLNGWKAENLSADIIHNLARLELTQLEKFLPNLVNVAYSRMNVDFVKGEIDFWRNQLKKL